MNAIYFLPLLLTNRNRNNIDIVAKGKYLPTIKEFANIILTFSLTSFAWIFFRSKTVSQAFIYIKNIFSFNFKGGIQYLSIDRYSVELVFLLLAFLVFEWFSREREHPFFGKAKDFLALVVILMIIVFGVYSDASEFIYFQF